MQEYFKKTNSNNEVLTNHDKAQESPANTIGGGPMSHSRTRN